MAGLRTDIEAGSRLSEAGAVAWRHRMLILIVTAIATPGALAWALAQPKVYTASSRILLSALGPKERKALGLAGPMSGSARLLSIETQAKLIGSSLVARQVSEAVHGKLSTEALSRAVDATVVGPNQIRITARAPRPELAQAEANAFADAYLAYRGASLANDVGMVAKVVADQKAALDLRISEADGTIEAAMVGLAGLPPAEQSDTAQQAMRGSIAADQEHAEAERFRLQKAREDLTDTEGGLVGVGGAGQVVSKATLPHHPAGPGPVETAVAGLAAGLILGVAGAFTMDRLSDRIGADDEGWTEGAPVLARLPRLRSGKASDLLVTASSDGSPAAEAYRTLREALGARGLGERYRILLVTSPGRREGKSATAANLAAALAGSGLQTIVVSADLRRPRLGSFFGVDDTPGLIEVLDRRATLEEALRPTGITNLRILPTSAARSTGSDRLATPAFSLLLRELADDADVVVVDAAAVADGADASILAGICGSSLLVVQDGVTLAGAAGRAVQALVRAGAAPLGAVVSPAPPVSARMRLAVSGFGAASILLGSVVWANANGAEEAAGPGATEGDANGSAVPQETPAEAPAAPLDPTAMADLETKVAPLLAAADPPPPPPPAADPPPPPPALAQGGAKPSTKTGSATVRQAAAPPARKVAPAPVPAPAPAPAPEPAPAVVVAPPLPVVATPADPTPTTTKAPKSSKDSGEDSKDSKNSKDSKDSKPQESPDPTPQTAEPVPMWTWPWPAPDKSPKPPDPAPDKSPKPPDPAPDKSPKPPDPAPDKSPKPPDPAPGDHPSPDPPQDDPNPDPGSGGGTPEGPPTEQPPPAQIEEPPAPDDNATPPDSPPAESGDGQGWVWWPFP